MVIMVNTFLGPNKGCARKMGVEMLLKSGQCLFVNFYFEIVTFICFTTWPLPGVANWTMTVIGRPPGGTFAEEKVLVLSL